jgi:hypothetical protein
MELQRLRYGTLTAYSTDDFEARSPDELSLLKGDRIELIERDDDFGDGWYLGKHIQNGKTGLFPEGEDLEDDLRRRCADHLARQSTPPPPLELSTCPQKPWLRLRVLSPDLRAVCIRTIFYSLKRRVLEECLQL